VSRSLEARLAYLAAHTLAPGTPYLRKLLEDQGTRGTWNGITGEPRSFSPWVSNRAPSKVLVIRLHAIGDVVATLPACVAFRQMLPRTRIDFLTSDACFQIPSALRLFDNVHRLTRSRHRWQRAFRTMALAVRIKREHYDVIVDLQRHRVSRFIRTIARPRAWGEFDRFSVLGTASRCLPKSMAL